LVRFRIEAPLPKSMIALPVMSRLVTERSDALRNSVLPVPRVSVPILGSVPLNSSSPEVTVALPAKFRALFVRLRVPAPGRERAPVPAMRPP
jgi:hypothetical protein